jgi:hypothetical protein
MTAQRPEYGPSRPLDPGQQFSGPDRPGPSAGRRVAAVAGLLAVAALGAVGGWMLAHRGGTSGTPAAVAGTSTSSTVPAAAAGSASASPSASSSPSAALADVARADPQAALTEYTKAGLRAAGNPVEAWTWTDANGRNLFLLTKTVEKREANVVRAATLHVYHATGLGKNPRTVLTLRDPGTAPCDLDFGLDFVPGSVKVTDTDGDGFAEATVGWWSMCRGDPGPERIKLALATKGTYYILRGTGLRASEPPLPKGIDVPSATFQPNVPESRWPRGTYAATAALFKQLFR